MSDTAHTIPGQSLLERLYARGAVRPHIGATPAFFERLGVPDPWLDEGQFSVDDQEASGLYFFLSSAPYYRRMRDQRQREWRARRKLLLRLSHSSHKLIDRAAGRMSGLVGGLGSTRGGTGASAWLSLKRSSSALTGESIMVMLPPILPAAEEEEGSSRHEWKARSPRPSQREGARRDTPLERASGARSRVASAVPAALEEVVQLATTTQRRVLRRIIEQVAEMPVEQQVIVARRVTRQLRGPLARAVRADVDDAAEQSSRRPASVAVARSAPPARRKGLRPVLHSSPAMQTLAFEEPVTTEAPEAPRRRVRVAPAQVTTARRDVPVARVAREVRTQRVTGRAGPDLVAADTAAASPRPRRRPMEWAATLAKGTERSIPDDSSYGLDALRKPARRRVGVSRIASRQSDPHATGSRGETLLAPSPTGFMRRRTGTVVPLAPSHTAPTERAAARSEQAPRRARRSRLVAAPPTAYVEPIGVEEVADQPTPSTRRISRRAVAADRRNDRGQRVLTASPVAADRAPARRLPVATSAEAPQRTTAPTWRAAARADAPERSRRASRRLIATPTSYVAPIERDEVEPVAESGTPRRRVRRTDAPTVRASRRVDPAPVDAPARERVVLSRAPTAYLEPMRDQAPETVVEPEQARRYGRSTVRAAARASESARTDTRGAGLLTSGATDYLQVARGADADGPLSRSPVEPTRRTRPMRTGAVDTDTVIRFEEPDAPVEAPASPRRRPTARAAQRLQASERTAAPASTPDTPAAAPRRRVLVRDAAGQVKRARNVATGAAAYASARLVSQGPAQRVTPLDRRQTSRRSAWRRAMPHTVASDDFSWLVPDQAPEPEVRVVGRRRTPTTVSRDQLDDVLSKVSAVVRAVERVDDARAIAPAVQRSLDQARVTGEPRRRRLPTSGGEGIVLRVILEDEPAERPVERAEKRGALPVRGEQRPAARPLRRALAGAAGFADEQLTDRVVARAQPQAQPRRRTAARTLRTADGRYAPSTPRRGPTPEPVAGYGLGAPGIPRHRARIDATTGAVLPAWAPEPESDDQPGYTPRPLRRTLGYLDEAGTRRRTRRPGPDTVLARSEDDEDEAAPTWAHRAVHGTGVRRRPEAEPDVAAQTVRTAPTGNLFQALARASRPEDVVQVILERGRSLRGAVGDLPESAVRLVDRIVSVSNEAGAQARYTRHTSADGEHLAPGRRKPSGASRAQLATLPKPAGAGSAAQGRRVTSLAEKLMKLIHLAEVERNLADAQRQVRMAEDTAAARAEAGHGEAGAAGPQEAPNLKKLESDVLSAVLRELDLMKLRRQEDFNDVWW